MSLPGQRLAAGGRPPPRRLRLRVRAGRGATCSSQGIRPRADHDQGGLRERHRRGHGARRLDQRRAAPAGHRQRGPGRARARRLQPGGRPGAAHRRHQAPRQVPHGRRRPHRRRARGDARAARRRAAPRRLPHRHRARPWPRTSAALDPPAPDGEVVHPLDRPDPRRRRHRRAARLAGPARGRGQGGRASTRSRFEGTARVFDGEQAAMEAILAGSIEPGTVVVIRYEGPKGGPGMREMLAVTGAMKGAGRGGDCALVTDGRFSRRHPRVLRRPRRARGGRRRAHRLRAPTATASSIDVSAHTLRPRGRRGRAGPAGAAC